MSESSLEQPQKPSLPREEVVSENDLKFILASMRGTPAEEFVKRFIAAEEIERNDKYAKVENAKLYLKEKRICIEALQNMRKGEVADILIQRLNR